MGGILTFEHDFELKRLQLEREIVDLETRLPFLGGLEWQREYDLYKALRRWKIVAYEPYLQLHAEGPLVKPAYPVLPGAASDWDFESASWVLDTAIYRSAPSSLRPQWAIYGHAVCKVSGTTNLPEGRVASWFYKEGSTYGRMIGLCCRLQYPTWTQCYGFHQWMTDGVGTGVFRWVRNDVWVWVGNTPEPPVNTWFQYRLTWWKSGDWFILRAERWDGSAWHNDAGDYLDQTPLWGTSAVNRCGLLIVPHATVERVRVDDTCIYGP